MGLTARPDDHGGQSIKTKYTLEELRRNLEALGISIDKDIDGRKKKKKKKKISKGTTENPDKGGWSRTGQNVSRQQQGQKDSLPMDILDVKIFIADLDDFLDKEPDKADCNIEIYSLTTTDRQCLILGVECSFKLDSAMTN